MTRQELKPYLLLCLPSLFWSGNFVLARALAGYLPPIGFVFWRWVVALLILLPLSWAALRPALPIVRRHWALMLAFGVLGVSAFNLLIYWAVNYTTAINAAVVNATTPLFVVLGSWLAYGEAMTRRQLLGVAVSLLGVLVIVAKGSLAELLALRPNLGDVLVLLAVLAWSAYSVLLRRRPAGIPPLAFVTATAAIGLVFLLPAYLWEHGTGHIMPLTPTSVGAVLYVAIFASILAFIFWNRGVAEVGANKAGLFMHLMPVFSTVLAVAFLGETLHGYHFAGIAPIVAGLWLVTVPPRAPRP